MHDNGTATTFEEGSATTTYEKQSFIKMELTPINRDSGSIYKDCRDDDVLPSNDDEEDEIVAFEREADAADVLDDTAPLVPDTTEDNLKQGSLEPEHRGSSTRVGFALLLLATLVLLVFALLGVSSLSHAPEQVPAPAPLQPLPESPPQGEEGSPDLVLPAPPPVPALPPYSKPQPTVLTYQSHPLEPISTTCPNHTQKEYETLLWNKMSAHPDLRCDAALLVRKDRPCRCLDPVVPTPRSPATDDPRIARLWHKTVRRNQDLLAPYYSMQSSSNSSSSSHDGQLRELDVLLLGDSITEHWLGTDFGMYTNKAWDACWEVYQDLFRRPGSPVAGMALGVGGDRTAHLLYRIRNGHEYLPRVPVVVVNIGTNDLGGDSCAADSVVAGVLAVVEEIKARQSRPQRIILSSILPRGGYHRTAEIWRDRVWQNARRVNQQLSCYAASTTDVEFLNGTYLFVDRDNPRFRNASLYADDVHPSALGYRVWGQVLVERVQKILALEKSASPNSIDIAPERSPVVTDAPKASITVSTTQNEIDTAISNWTDFVDTTLRDQDWCVADRWNPGGNKPCKCYPPGMPVACDKKWAPQWNYTVQRNLDLIQQQQSVGLDVVLLGDSIMEHWQGTDFATPSKSWNGAADLYQQLFRKEDDSTTSVRGLALGVAGDRCSNLLYRLRRGGELADNLQPAVWWILIGTNDLGIYGDACNSQAVATGILVITKEILKRRPDATVVLNSILPRDSQQERNLWKTPEWIVASEVNHLLQDFGTSTERVEFFNATELFVSPKNPVRKNRKLYQDPVHPSTAGYSVWGNAIVSKVKQLVPS